MLKSQHLLHSSQNWILVAKPDAWTFPNNTTLFNSDQLPLDLCGFLHLFGQSWQRCRVKFNKVMLQQANAKELTRHYGGTVGMSVSIMVTNWTKRSQANRALPVAMMLWVGNKGHKGGFPTLYSKRLWNHLSCCVFTVSSSNLKSSDIQYLERCLRTVRSRKTVPCSVLK